MARFLLVNQYYWPDLASTGQHLTDLAEHLARAGHDVRVLCSRGRYLEGKGDAPTRERRGGVDIRRVRATSFGKRRQLGRLVDYLTFHLLAAVHVLLARRTDVVVTLTTPPLIGVWGTLARLLSGAKHVCFVMDLHPDAEFETGMLRRDSLAGRILEGLSAGHMRRADRCVVLGRHQARLLREKGVPDEKVELIRIWSRKDEIEPVAHAQNPVRERLGWSDRFVVAYSGNAGLAHTFDEVLEAARVLAEKDPHVRFAFIGDGPRTPEIRAFVERHGLANVELLPYFPREELRYSIPAADLHLVTLREEFRGVAVPGKLYGCLAAGRPVLYVGPADSDTAEAVERSGAGTCVPLGDAAGVVDAVRALVENAGQREACGRAGREYFLSHHEAEACCRAWQTLLEEVAAERRTTHGRHAPAR